MQLDEFIETSLVQICRGIRNAQKQMIDEIGSYPIAPAYVEGKRVYDKKGNSINFDVLVTISKDKQLDVSASVMGIGAKGNIQGEETKAHRLQFAVPFFPQGLRASDDIKKDK